jgi:hypothetical protein
MVVQLGGKSTSSHMTSRKAWFKNINYYKTCNQMQSHYNEPKKTYVLPFKTMEFMAKYFFIDMNVKELNPKIRLMKFLI